MSLSRIDLLRPLLSLLLRLLLSDVLAIDCAVLPIPLLLFLLPFRRFLFRSVFLHSTRLLSLRFFLYLVLLFSTSFQLFVAQCSMFIIAQY